MKYALIILVIVLVIGYLLLTNYEKLKFSQITKESLIFNCLANVPNITFGTPLIYKNLIWPHMPLKVYIDYNESNKTKLFSIYKSDLLGDFRKAMKTWEAKTNGLISFVETNDSKNYDVYVKWVEELNRTAVSKDVGVGGPDYIATCPNYGIIENASILILPDLTGCRGYYINLHELGHVLGFGHSDDPSDVMYPNTVGCATEISENEISVIRALYS